MWSPFGWSTKRNFSEDSTLDIGPFQKIQREVIYFSYVANKKKWKAAINCPKILAYMVKSVKFLDCIIFLPWDAFIICKMNEKTGQMYQNALLHIQLKCFSVGPGFSL